MSHFEGIHALIIEDTATDAEVLRSLLERLGVSYSMVNDSRKIEAVLGESQAPNVIFLDLELPGGNGYQVIELLRALPATTGVPVVAYTSHNSEMANARDRGFHSFLGKPLKQGQFAEQLSRILNDEAVWEVR